MLHRKNILIKRTGHDYDCIAVVTNNNDEDCVLSIKCPKCEGFMTDNMAGSPWYLKAGDSFMLFANDMGYTMLEAMESNIFCIEESKYFNPNDYDYDYENFANSVFDVNCLTPCICIECCN